jgi:membrane protease subunit HflK
MPWSNQSGGGGPWKPNNPGPWGQGPSGSPPDLEALLRGGQEKLKEFLSGGSFGGGRAILALVLLGSLIWLLSGFYTVQSNQVGLNQVFGRYTGKTAPGLHYNFPSPVGSVIKLPVLDQMIIDVGGSTERSGSVDKPEESLMLTGDENIADVKFRVIWQIDPERPEDYAYNIGPPVAQTVKAVAESAMREIVGRTPIENIFASDRKYIEPAAQELMQKILNDYKAGVKVVQVQLLSVDPPVQVIAAFKDVTASQQDQQRLSNEAEAYANKVVPEARGDAARIVQEAEAFREQTVKEALGQASRYNQVYEQYKKAPDVTRQRIYLETMERIFAGMDKVIVDQTGGGVVPYLPLNELTRKPGGSK